MSKVVVTRGDLVDAVMGVLEGAKSVVVFCRPLARPVRRVKATLIGKLDRRDKTVNIRLAVGRLNWKELARVKRLKERGARISRVWASMSKKGR